jgi:hypothetical protein
MQMPNSMLPQGNYYGGQMPMHPSQQRGSPTGPRPGYHSGQYMPPPQQIQPGINQRRMHPGMPNMPPNIILGPSGMPYYPGQGGQMPYRAAATMLVLGQRLQSSIDPTSARMGKWTAEEDSMLKEAVQTHGGKNWIAIAAWVPGRTKAQCYNRWRDVLDSSINLASGRKDK